MCGIAGLFGDGALHPGDPERLGLDMIGRIRHRGPDAQAVWVDPDAPLVLAHARLSIIDLAETGAQPMHSADGRHAIVYNGEIYNFRELRSTLDAEGGRRWRGHSDTEVLLAAIDAWGVEGALGRVVGMFAFALWDRATATLSLARDRFGEKPLYVQPLADGLLFGSELAAFDAHPLAARDVEPAALASLLRHGCVHAPLSIRRGVYKVEPGTVWHCRTGEEPRVERYWSAAEVAARGAASPFAGTDEEALDELDSRLGRAVRGQMTSDVPLGAFLSGGIDSSLVVALMQKHAERPVRTFSIGFADESFDEAPWAARVAGRLGTEHTELYVEDAEVLDLVPRLASVYSEPFADSSQLPTLLVAGLARRHVTVALSGDAGDEVFCGYNRYRFARDHWPRIERVPRGLRRALGSTLHELPPGAVDLLARHTPGLRRLSRPGEKLRRGATLLAAADVDALYAGLAQVWRDPAEVLAPEHADAANAGFARPAFLAPRPAPPPDLSPEQRMMLADQTGYLPDDILVKVDRAAMSFSLETRAPFLDHRVAALGWSLPPRMRVRDGEGKWATRSLLERYLPPELVRRPKMGFSIPLHALLRGPLRSWADAQLEPARLAREGWFRPKVVDTLWREHRDGGRDHTLRLWALLMFQSWLEAETSAGAEAVAVPSRESRHG